MCYVVDRSAGEFLADGAADERVVAEHPDLRHVARVIADRDLVPGVGGEVHVDVARPGEVGAVPADPPRHGRGQRHQG